MMDIEELKQQLDEFRTKATALEEEKARILAKNKELLDEAKKAKSQRNEFQQQLDELKAQLEHGDDVMTKANEIASKKIETLSAEYEEKLAEAMENADKYRQQFESLRNQYSTERLANEIRAVAEKSKVLPTAIDDIVLRAQQIFKLNEEGQLEARDAEGNLLKAGKKVLTPEVFIETLKEKAPHFWPQSQGSGMAQGQNGSSYTGKNPFKPESRNLTEQFKLKKENPDLARRLAEEAGIDTSSWAA
jgi:chromosome segregation ATPase